MELYDYRDWIGWPEEDIREYAQELAQFLELAPSEAEYMESEMAKRAGFATRPAPRFGPWKMDARMEEMFLAIPQIGTAVFEQNRRFNRPWDPSKYELEMRTETVGAGLTRKYSRRIVRESVAMRKVHRRDRRSQAELPYTTMNSHMRNLAEHAMWFANCYPSGRGSWFIPREQERPEQGLAWYSRQLLAAYYNARDQAALGNLEGAMWHAHRAGRFQAELEIRLAHGEVFDRYEAVRETQRSAALARKTISDEVRRETYWRYRNEGNKRIEAGRLAAEELGLSEPSIRNAFPGAKYPTD